MHTLEILVSLRGLGEVEGNYYLYLLSDKMIVFSLSVSLKCKDKLKMVNDEPRREPLGIVNDGSTTATNNVIGGDPG